MASCSWHKITSFLLFILVFTCHCNARNATSVEDIFQAQLVARNALFQSSTKISKRNPPSYDFTKPHDQHIVAIGDLNGDLQNTMDVLKLSEVLNRRGKWSGLAHAVVQVGGVVDQGPDTLQLIDFLEWLRAQGKERVFTLMGGDELRNLIGDWRGVSDSDIKSFGSWEERWKEIRGRISDIWASNYMAALRLPLHPSIGPPNTPPGHRSSPFSHAALLFVHGGFGPNYHLSHPFPTAINDILKQLIHGLQRMTVHMPTPKNPGGSFAGGDLIGLGNDLLKPDSPLSYDGWNNPDCKQVDEVLRQTKTRRVIVGHVVVDKISPKCNNKLILINTGISRMVRGHRSALVIQYNVKPVIEQDGQVKKLEEEETIYAQYMNGIEELVHQERTIHL